MKMERQHRRWVIPSALAILAAVVAIGIATMRGGGENESPEPEAAAAMEGMDMGGMQMSTDGSVRLTADQIRTFGITFGTAERRTLQTEVRAVGIVSFDETRIAQVAPKFGGFVERLYVDFTGQAVRPGQPLLEIYSPELVAAQEELLLAAGLDARLGESSVPGVAGSNSKLAEIARRRLRLWDISDAQIDEVLRTGLVRRTLTLHSPVAGVVVDKPVVQGQAVQPGQTLYTIADLSEVWVEAELREQDAASVRQGSAAMVELNAFPGRTLRGRVEYVYPTLESESRTLKARIAIPNPDGRIKPGMYATVRFSTPAGETLTVPTSAVLRTGDGALVFVDMGNSLMPQEVEIGRVAGGYTEILSGVEPGQRVVTSAQFLLDSESNLAEVMKSMIGMSDDMPAMDMSGERSVDGMENRGADMRGMPMPGQER